LRSVIDTQRSLTQHSLTLTLTTTLTTTTTTTPAANGAFPANDAAGQTVAAMAEADKISAGTSALKNALLHD
jgi:hypothetical protein